MDLPLIVFSHSEFSDILSAQIELNQDLHFSERILLINNGFNNDEIKSKFDKIIYYDQYLNYPKRLSLLNELDYKYVFFIHDIDLILESSNEFIEKIYNIVKTNKIDRVDFQNFMAYNENYPSIKIDGMDDVKLVKQTDSRFYPYNVNPSIWKLSTLLDIMGEEKIKDKDYRGIEEEYTQNYVSKYNIFKFYDIDNQLIGYYNCSKYFQYLHVTHGRELVPLGFKMSGEVNEKYKSIRNKFLQNRI